jgi:hypothetical protein
MEEAPPAGAVTGRAQKLPRSAGHLLHLVPSSRE